MKRLESLDSLRGVAAMIVVIHHCAMTIPGVRAALANSYIARPLIIGPSAVSVFFVLSGMVLYGTFDGKDGFHYGPFLIKRITRLYPPVAAAVLVSLGLYFLIQPHPIIGLTVWFNNRSWSEVPSVKMLLGHLLLLDPWRYTSLDNVIWSLVHEMRISIVFPLLAIALRARLWTTVTISVLVSLAAAWATSFGYATPHIDLVPTFQYVDLFAAGAAMAIKRDALMKWFAAPQRSLQGLAILVAGVAMLCFEQSKLVIGIGSVLVVMACFTVPVVERALCHRSLVWLGKVSYSLYLFHLLVLLTLVHLFAGTVPIPLLLAATVPLSLLVAGIAFRLIEEPSKQIGRKIAGDLMLRRSRFAEARAASAS